MVVDDEPAIRSILEKMIEKQEEFRIVSSCGTFAEAVTDYTKYRPEVVFMDIDLAGASGMECAKVMTELDPKVRIIFATAHSEFMANAFEIYAFDYLVKPFNLERVEKTLSRIRSMEGEGLFSHEHVIQADEISQGEGCDGTLKSSELHKDKLLIKGREQLIFIDKKDIIMVERVDGATYITTAVETYKTSVALGNIEEKLEESEFMRCHKSYIIKLSEISQIEVYGRWTYIVKFKNTECTALMTAQKYEEVKKRYE